MGSPEAAWRGRLSGVAKLARDGSTLLPGAVYLAVLVLSLVLGCRFQIPWTNYQILDRDDLATHALLSLLLLHAQPPLLNAWLALHLKLERWFGIAPEPSLAIVFTVLGLVATILLYRLVLALTRRRSVALVTILALLLDPAHMAFAQVGFYTFPTYCFCAVFVRCLHAYFTTGARGALVGLAAALTAMALAHTLFHPAWALMTIAAVILLRRRLRPPSVDARRAEIVVLAAAALVLVAWPAKNLAVFGRFSQTSWTGYNLARPIPHDSDAITDFNATGIVPPGIVHAVRIPEWAGPAGRAMLTRPRKGPAAGNAANWNHILFLAVDRELVAIALRWRREEPGFWFGALVPYHYACYTHAPIVHPYSRAVHGPTNPQFRAFATAHTRLFYPDVYPVVAGLIGLSAPRPDERAPDGLYPRFRSLTLFGLLWFPLVIGFGLWCGVRVFRDRRPESAFLLVTTSVLLWPLAVTLLVDGAEGMRFRFATLPAFAIVAAAGLTRAWERLRAWRAPAREPR